MIQEGLLWFDDSQKRSLADKVTQAAQRYQQKYGRAPNVCYVHPQQPGMAEGLTVAGVRVLPFKGILPNNFWLGILPEVAHDTQAAAFRAAFVDKGDR